MQQPKLDYNTQEIIITRLLDNLEHADKNGKRKILKTLLEHTDVLFLQALYFAIEMTPKQVPSKEQ